MSRMNAASRSGRPESSSRAVLMSLSAAFCSVCLLPSLSFLVLSEGGIGLSLIASSCGSWPHFVFWGWRDLRLSDHLNARRPYWSADRERGMDHQTAAVRRGRLGGQRRGKRFASEATVREETMTGKSAWRLNQYHKCKFGQSFKAQRHREPPSQGRQRT